jgi:hypothetical protein
MKVSETELAWVVGERALAAAERAEAPLLVGASAYHLGHTFLRAGRIREATDLTMDAVAALAPSREAETERLALWGALHLTALFGAARGNDRRAGPAGLRRPGRGPRRRWGSGDATIWRTCPSCFGSFEQPDDPGRKRVYCSRACQQAAYRARQRSGAGQRSNRQDWRSSVRSSAASTPASSGPTPASTSTKNSRPAAPAAITQRQRPPVRRRQQRRAGAHPAHHRRPAAQGRRHHSSRPRPGQPPGREAC